MELVNGPDFYDESYPWIEEHKLTILADSDAHDPVPPRTATWHRPVTLVFARTVDLDGVRDALTARRTAAWLGENVWGAEEYLSGLWAGAIALESPTLDRKRGLALRLRNTSAITMKIVVKEAPDWFVLTPPLQLSAESATIIRPQLTAAAPPGDQKIVLTLEITNLHTGPEKNLLVQVPLTVK
jgi:hypothetical protein